MGWLPFLLAMTVSSTGAGPSLRQHAIEVWDEDRGLPQAAVHAVIQTPDGYLWVGTQQGLYRFDGVTFAPVQVSAAMPIGRSQINALHVDHGGTLWVGTEGRGAFRMTGGAWSHVEGIPGTLITDFAEDANGVWIASVDGGISQSRSDGTIRTLGRPDGLPAAGARTLASDGTSLWIGSGRGLYRFDGRVLQPVPHPVLDGSVLTTLTADRGSVWVGTQERGLFQLVDGEIRSYGSTEGLLSPVVRALRVDRRGNVWVGTSGAGVHRLRNGTFENLGAAEGLPPGIVYSIVEDAEDSVWVGTLGGLVRIRETRFTPFGVPEGLQSDTVLAVLEDREGALWVGSGGAGVARIAPGGSVRTWDTRGGPLSHGVILALLEDKDGTIWIGMSSSGLATLKDGVLRQWQVKDGLAAGTVKAVHQDVHGAIWAGTFGGGLQRWSGGPRVRLTQEGDGLASNFVHTIVDAPDGGLLVGTRSGLSLVRDGKVLRTWTEADGLPSPDVAFLGRGSTGDEVWIAGAGGVARLRDGAIDSWTARHGMVSAPVHGVIEDGLGAVWFSTNDGIYSAPRVELDAVARGDARKVSAVRYGRSDGMRSREANGGVQPPVVKRRDGTLWFPTMSGLVRIDPASVAPNPRPPPVSIKRLVSKGTEHPLGGALPDGVRDFEIDYAGLGFRAPEQVRFKYRLLGLDDTWVDAGSRRTAYFQKIPPGRYRFQVIAANEDGVWNDVGASLDIDVPARFHETWAFTGLCGGIGLLGLALLYRRRVAVLEARHRELLALTEERARAKARQEHQEHLLEGAQRNFQLAIDRAPDGMLIARDSTLLYANDAFASTLGVENRGALAGRDLLDVVHPDDRDWVRMAVSGDKEGGEVRLVKSDGQVVDVELSAAERIDFGGAPARLLIARDITVRKKMQAQLLLSDRMASVGVLAAGVAHEINNPLCFVISNLAYIDTELRGRRAGELDRDVLEALADAQDGAQRVRRSVGDLKLFSRTPSDETRPVDVRNVFERALKIAGNEIRHRAKVVSHLSEVPPVLGDESRLAQVFLNLVVNAAQSIREGNVEANTLTVRTREEEGWVVAEVSDTGCGIAPDVQARLFEPFFTTKPVGQGTGLGLAICRQIVAAAGGSITVQSTPGAGSTFRVRLPVAADHLAAREAGIAAMETQADVDSARVLMIDDEPLIGIALRRLLDSRHRLTIETDPRRAVELLEAGEPFDLVLCDVMMPQLSGIDLYRRLLVSAPRQAENIVFLTGGAFTEDARAFIASAVVPVVAKPFDRAAIDALIAARLEKKAADRDASGPTARAGRLSGLPN